ncbi:MAG: ComEC/Rec2 family competence protein [Armatimonadota bacterium]
MKAVKLLFVWFLLLVVLTGQSAAAELSVSFIDVGQGDSILVEFPCGKTILVDAGPSSAGRPVVDYLKSRGVKALDTIVATHPHEDHIGGMKAVLNAFPVGRFWDSGFYHGSGTQKDMLSTIDERGILFFTPKAGFTEKVGDVSVSVLAPQAGAKADSANNQSLVILIVYGKTSFLLAGDMESQERQSVDFWPESTVLKVAHHGSFDGTDPALLRQVKPKIAVISCGRDNPFGHPDKATLDALQAVGAVTYVTAEVGTIVVTSNGVNVTVETKEVKSHHVTRREDGCMLKSHVKGEPGLALFFTKRPYVMSDVLELTKEKLGVLFV